jgi:hypothetical protein
MRIILAFLCLFCGSPDDAAADSVDGTQEPKVERYRVFLSELASSRTTPEIKALIDLPEDLKDAIEAWTGIVNLKS